MPIKSNLISIMEKKSIGYEELQYLSNTSPDTVAIARDDRISSCQLKTLEKIANALDVSVHDLFEHIRYPQ